MIFFIFLGITSGSEVLQPMTQTSQSEVFPMHNLDKLGCQKKQDENFQNNNEPSDNDMRNYEEHSTAKSWQQEKFNEDRTSSLRGKNDFYY